MPDIVVVLSIMYLTYKKYLVHSYSLHAVSAEFPTSRSEALQQRTLCKLTLLDSCPLNLPSSGKSFIMLEEHMYSELVDEWKTKLMSLAILFHFLCAQHFSDINIFIIRKLRLCCWIIASVTSGWSFILQLLQWCTVE